MRDPVQVFGNLKGTWSQLTPKSGSVGGAICGNFALILIHVMSTFRTFTKNQEFPQTENGILGSGVNTWWQ